MEEYISNLEKNYIIELLNYLELNDYNTVKYINKENKMSNLMLAEEDTEYKND